MRARTIISVPRPPLRFVTAAAVAVAVLVTAGSAGGAFPGKNGRIAFADRIGANWEIFSMRADGTARRRLTNNLLNDTSPTWSPDGSRIAFRSDRAGNPEIYVMNADGSGLERLTRRPLGDTRPSWSPDGTRIVYQRFKTGGQGLDPRTAEIAVMNADGSGVKVLTNNTIEDLNPSWSPDGKRIAFASQRVGAQFDIYVMSADGSRERRVTRTVANEMTPACQPRPRRR